MFSTALKLNCRGCLRSAHGLFCLYRFSGQSARAGQTLAKKAIKVEKSAGEKRKHGVHSYAVNSGQKIQSQCLPVKLFKWALVCSSDQSGVISIAVVSGFCLPGQDSADRCSTVSDGTATSTDGCRSCRYGDDLGQRVRGRSPCAGGTSRISDRLSPRPGPARTHR
jgi:hypothetical protein